MKVYFKKQFTLIIVNFFVIFNFLEFQVTILLKKEKIFKFKDFYSVAEYFLKYQMFS